MSVLRKEVFEGRASETPSALPYVGPERCPILIDVINT
jgi:hypothetical protein